MSLPPPSPLTSILTRIEHASNRAARSTPASLLAVTKRQAVERIEQICREWQSQGQTLRIAENYVQALVSRQEELQAFPSIEWHLIGPLQSNKARLAVAHAHVIQSIHAEKIARVVQDEAKRISKRQRIYVQVNISGDAAKSGVASKALPELLRNILAQCPNLVLEGLMTITEHFENPEDARKDFSAMRALRDAMSKDFNMPLTLSMGMSEDFELAIEEGADIVRIGSALFGERQQ